MNIIIRCPLHPPHLCRIAVFSIKPTFSQVSLITSPTPSVSHRGIFIKTLLSLIIL